MAKPFTMHYRTYDDRHGRGTTRQWRQVFNATMGLDEARRRVGRRTPEALLGVPLGSAWAAIRSAYRARSLECHPDRCAVHGLTEAVATERFKELTAAFILLKARVEPR